MIFKFCKTTIITSIILTCSFVISSCVPAAIVGGAGLVGYSMVQERTVGEAIDDIAIETEINALFLAEDDKNLFLNIDIDSVEGRVLLTGSVPTRKAKIDAYKISWQPEGVKEVINEINVSKEKKFSASKYASDAWISTQIESKMLFSKDIASVNYSVETIGGVVYLMGVAKDRQELEKVAEISSTVQGVNKVVSHVRIKDKKYPKPQYTPLRKKAKIAPSDFENSSNTEPKYLEEKPISMEESY